MSFEHAFNKLAHYDWDVLLWQYNWQKIKDFMFHEWNLQNKKNANFLREFF